MLVRWSASVAAGVVGTARLRAGGSWHGGRALGSATSLSE